ncbi:MAG TPA: GNAT family N-acetyltransferase [Anaerolineae bacterium]|nr:GNAT family N-acetyltransferase [Anaerolineae bacterium]
MPATSTASSETPPQLVPARAFRIEQLTVAYNQTRVDYLVPMPMNAARLAEYIHTYDVDLDRSVVALAADQILGLGMLGVRQDRVWLTRLGVLPVQRRRGVGEVLTRALLAAADELGIRCAILEVIKHNTPAHALFLKLGFHEIRELLVLRRPPQPPASVPAGQARWFETAEALARLATRPTPPAWTHENESFAKADRVLGLALALGDGSSGWLVVQQQRFILSRLVLHTERGDPAIVGRALLARLYQQYPDVDTHAENIPAGEPHLPALFEAGFVESFSRIEMHRTA